MFDNVGRSLDQEALARQGASALVSLLLLGGAGGAFALWGIWRVAEEFLPPPPMEEMVEVELVEEALDDAPPPPPPPPAASAQPETEEEQETEPDPEVVPETVENLDKIELAEADPPPSGSPDGVEGGQEGGEQGGMLGGTVGGTGTNLNGVMTLHHSEVKKLRTPMPTYPEAAEEMNLGEVNCRVTFFIDEKGVPYQLDIKDTCPKVFHQTTRDALMGWRFEPAKVGGVKVKAQFVLNIKYVQPS